jgi:bla regulator protein blaR1
MSAGIMETWLFDSLLVTTLLMGVILLVRRPVAKLFGPGVAYALWLIPAARLLMPSLEGAAVTVGESGLAVQDAVRDAILAGVTSPGTVATTAHQAAVLPSIDYVALGVTFWLGGAALFFIIQMIRYASMRDDLLSEANEIAHIGGVSIVASDQVAGPLAFGLFKRYIAVPQDFTKAYSPAERELAIAHEMAHHKSGDLFANLVAFIILCLQWFNPVAWMSWNAFRFDQEAACDARVLAGKGAEERAIYGQALAKTAFDGVPTFATALNSPKTIIERLRRLTMKDASNTRRSMGKLGILAAAAVILPLTATIVPAVRADENAEVAQIAKKPAKLVKISIGTVVDGKPTGSVVKTISRDGKTYVFHSDKKLSDDEVEQWIDGAQTSHEEADDAMARAEEARGEAEAALGEAEAARGEAQAAVAEAAAMRGHAEAMRVHAIAMSANYVPEIDIREITKNCREGQPVTTNVEGFDGTNKSRIRLVMCGKGQARIARVEAIKGLREARGEIASETDMPAGVRKDVIEKLEKEIRKLEAQTDTSN